MKLTFQHIISENIKENSKLENAIFKFLKRKEVWHYDGEDDYDENRDKSNTEVANEVVSVFGLDEWDALFFTFKWLVKHGHDPIESGGSDREIQYWVKNEDDGYQFLQDTGWWDKFFRPYEFSDIVEKGKGKNKQKFLQADSYYDFKPLFDQDWLSDVVLGEDYEEIFGWYDHPLSEIWDNVNDKGLQAIIEALPSYAPKDGVIWVPESFEEITDDGDDRLLIDQTFINFIKDGNTSSLLYDLIEESGDFDALKHDMINYYNIAYNDAAHSEIFDNAMSELESFFGEKPKWVTVPGPDENTVLHKVEIPIKQEDYDDLYRKWLDYFSDFPEHSYSEYIDSWGEVLDNDGGKLQLPDTQYFYPDHNVVDDYFNDALQQNLYGSN